MARKSITITALAATLAMALTPVAATAHDRGWHDDRGWHEGRDRDDRRGHYDQRGGYGYYGRDYRPAYGNQYGYQQRGYYADTRYDRRNYGRGYDSRCRGNGTTGTIVGAIAGGLLGNSVAGRGDRTLGTILGGGVGAVAGRAIDRADDRC